MLKQNTTNWVVLKTTEINFLTALEKRSLRSRWQQSHSPSEGSRGGSFFASCWLLVVAEHLWCFLACSCIIPISVSIFVNFLFYIGVYVIISVVLVSGVQQSDSVIHIHASILFQIYVFKQLFQNVNMKNILSS